MKKKLNTDQLNEVISLAKKILHASYFILIAGIIIAALFLGEYLGLFKLLKGILKVISPLFIGFTIAWLFNPIVKKLHEKGLSKIISALLVYFVFLVFLILFIKVFIPVVYAQINELINSLPSIFTKLESVGTQILDQFSLNGFDLNTVKNNMIHTVELKLISLVNNLPNIIINFVIKLFSGLGIGLLSLVVGLYMLFDFDSIAAHFLKIIPPKNRYEIKVLLDKIETEVRKSVNGTLLVASMVLVTDTIGFTIVGLKAPLLFGLFCGLTDLIPYIGPYIGGVAAVVVGFSQSNVIGLTTLIIVIIVQLVESYILQPVVMSKAMHLHPVTIIVGLLIFGYFFGIIGMIIATPCLALIKVLWFFIKGKFNLTNPFKSYAKLKNLK